MIWPHISPFRCLFSLKFPAPGSCNWPRFTSVMLCETCCVEELGAGLGWCWPIWCPPPFHTLHHIPWDKLHTMVDSLHVEEQMLSMKVPSYWTHFKNSSQRIFNASTKRHSRESEATRDESHPFQAGGSAEVGIDERVRRNGTWESGGDLTSRVLRPVHQAHPSTFTGAVLYRFG